MKKYFTLRYSILNKKEKEISIYRTMLSYVGVLVHNKT